MNLVTGSSDFRTFPGHYWLGTTAMESHAKSMISELDPEFKEADAGFLDKRRAAESALNCEVNTSTNCDLGVYGSFEGLYALGMAIASSYWKQEKVSADDLTSLGLSEKSENLIFGVGGKNEKAIGSAGADSVCRHRIRCGRVGPSRWSYFDRELGSRL